MYRLITSVAVLAFVIAPRVVSSECVGFVTQEGSEVILDCRAPCEDHCQTGIGVLPGVGYYSFCKCTGGEEEECCHMALLLELVPPLPMTKGDCSAQQSGCPTGSQCHDHNYILGDTIIYYPHCGDH
jgi:hypothetical protein